MCGKNKIFLLLLLFFEHQYFYTCTEQNITKEINQIISLDDTSDNNSTSTITKSDETLLVKNDVQLLYSFSTDKLTNTSDGSDTTIKDLPIMQWFGKLLDHHEWTIHYLHNVGLNCQQDVVTYLENLQNGTIWAIKMNDASGKYNGELFFGNNLWLGSKSLCYELQNEQYNTIIPPFEAHFYVTKLRIDLANITSIPRFLSIGLCLPKSCSPDEIKSILNEHTTESKNQLQIASLDILAVRSVPGEFNIFAHGTFYVAGGCIIILTILLLSSTCYEYLLNREISKQNMKIRNNVVGVIVEENDEHTITTTTTANNNNVSMNNNNNNHSKILNNERGISLVNSIVQNTNHNISNGNGTAANGTHVNGIGKSTERFVTINDENGTSERGLLSELLLCFSIISNGKKILSFEKPPSESITCVHGLRFISLFWVIMVHTYLSVYQAAKNKHLRKVTERNFMFQTVSNATFSVDSFFFISGLLLAVLYYRSEEKNKSKRKLPASANSYHIPSSTSHPQKEHHIQREIRINTLKFLNLLFYRFIRLTPTYMFILCLYDILIKLVGNSSVFDLAITSSIDNCDRYWWRNLFYINNLYPMSEMCMVWTWYLANDTQFYVVGIILLLISLRSVKLAFGILSTFLLSSWITTFAISNYYNYHARVEAPFDLFDQLYGKPWTRIGPYLIGMITGWILFKINLQMKIPKTLAILCWSFSLLCLCSLVYGLGQAGLKPPLSSLYVSVGHAAWAISLGWIVVACSTGYGCFINTLLSFRGLLPLSRLTYCAYLIHPIVMAVSSHLRDGPIHLHNVTVIILVCGNTVISFLFAFVVSLAFEAPVVRILQILLKR